MMRRKKMPSNKPYGTRIKVRLLPVEEFRKPGSLIVVAESVESRYQDAVEKGVLVDKGHCAFKNIEGMDDADIPLGSVVIFPQYAGRIYTGTDGERYRIFEDQDIYAVEVDEDEPEYNKEPKEVKKNVSRSRVH